MMNKQSVLNEIKISYTQKDVSLGRITSSVEAFNVAKEVYKQTDSEIDLKEYFFIILLNRNNKVVGYHKLSEGGISGTVADPKLAFATALKCASSAMILIHNHPSGATRPSNTDNSLTRKFVEAGNLLDITVLDHLVITNDGYYSYADDGMI